MPILIDRAGPIRDAWTWLEAPTLRLPHSAAPM